MASAAPASPPNAPKNLGLQPDEPILVRYSPHGELPLSSVTSFVIHGLVIGLACLAIWSASRFLDHPTRSLPIQTVQLASGGGGDPNGVPGGTGTGTAAAPQEAGPEQPTQPGAESRDPDPARPELTPIEGPQTPLLPETNAKPTMQQGNTMEAINALREQGAQMRKAVAAGPKGHGGPRPKGKGGSGEGGGEGSGRGPGKGAGTGPGEAQGNQNLTRTQKRMLRWTMIFDTHTGPDYLRQLAGLGAVLAIPVKETAKGAEYRIVQNRNLLNPPARLVNEDLSKFKGIHWTDNDPNSVTQVMQTLGLPLQPSHFVAFMPPQLEDRLAQLEKKYKNLAEEDIYETRFRIMPTGNGYTPVVVEQTPKSAAPAGQ